MTEKHRWWDENNLVEQYTKMRVYRLPHYAKGDNCFSAKTELEVGEGVSEKKWNDVVTFVIDVMNNGQQRRNQMNSYTEALGGKGATMQHFRIIS